MPLHRAPDSLRHAQKGLGLPPARLRSAAATGGGHTGAPARPSCGRRNMKVLFWIALLGLALPAYSYLVYPLILFVSAGLVQAGRDVRYLIQRAERRSGKRDAPRPSVSIIVAAYNEEQVIGATLAACTGVDYPRERLEVIVGADGCTDGTAQVARQREADGVRVIEFPSRRGKVSTISDCVRESRGEILVFTDANTLLKPEAVALLVRHFHDPRVGAVCGELRLTSATGEAHSEGIYWRYEVTLKILESRLNAVLGANGAIYAVRKELFPDVSMGLVTDDFVIPMKIRAEGHRVLYDPEAVATEQAPGSARDEFRRRTRIGAGNWQALRHCARLLLPGKGFVSLAFWSHKVLRWFAPFLLAAALIANAFLLSSPLWQCVFAAQVAFYAAALAGYVLRKLHLPSGPLTLASYFVTINAALAVGFARGAVHAQAAAWERTRRDGGPSPATKER